MDIKTACIFGGSGFLGRQIVRELASAGYRIKVVSRIPEAAFDLKPCGTVGQVVPVLCDYQSDEHLAQILAGCQVAINCIGELSEKGRRNSFEKIHAELPGRIAKACASQNVGRLIHISSLGIQHSKARYAKSKLKGEEAVLNAFPAATILRPSIMFGTEDDFFNKFARMALISPFLPLIGGGETKFQLVYVGDVADAVMTVLRSGDHFAGKVIELGGPEVFTFKDIYRILFNITGRPRTLISLPFGPAKFAGAILSLSPCPPLTADQVEMLKTDNVVSGNALTFEDLGIRPTALHTILPGYLSCYRMGGRFSDKKRA